MEIRTSTLMEGSSFSSSSAPSVDSLLGAENDGLRVSDRIPLLLRHRTSRPNFWRSEGHGIWPYCLAPPLTPLPRLTPRSSRAHASLPQAELSLAERSSDALGGIAAALVGSAAASRRHSLNVTGAADPGGALVPSGDTLFAEPFVVVQHTI